MDNKNNDQIKAHKLSMDELANVSGGRQYWDENGRFIDEDGYYDSEGNYHTESDPERIH